MLVLRVLMITAKKRAVVAQGEAQEQEEVYTAAKGCDGTSEGAGPHGLEVERLGECEQDIEGEARVR